MIHTSFPILDNILAPWQPAIGADFDGYRNHIYRMLNHCLALRSCSEEEQHKLAIAGAFHDIGIWSDQTIDYIDPSVAAAQSYLREQSLEHWAEEISLMISEHHKLRSAEHPDYPLVEVFRQADLVDFSLGIFRCGLSAEHVRAVKKAIPNAGFHAGLVRKAGRWFLRHPLNPAPMMKW